MEEDARDLMERAPHQRKCSERGKVYSSREGQVDLYEAQLKYFGHIARWD